MCFRPTETTFQMNCPRCGEKVSATDTVCPNCGATEADFATSARPGAPGAPKPPGAPGVPSAPRPPAPRPPGQ